MKLAQLLATARLQGREMVAIPDIGSEQDREIGGVFYDSRNVSRGGLFVAVQGYAADGHDFIEQALAQGAAAIVCQRPVSVAKDVAVVQVVDTRRALAQLAAAFYGHPSQGLTVIGVTGTNGKTTTSFLIESILQTAGWKTGVIGTINCRYDGRVFDNPVTTPGSLELQHILSDMRAAGVSHVVMEVSSHALEQYRLHSCKIDLALFTNLTQDHLDFHGDMDSYWTSKRKLFLTALPALGSALALRAVINCRDPRGAELSRDLKLPHLTTGPAADTDIYPETAAFTQQGVAAQVVSPLGTIDLHCALTGHYNLENMLCSVGAGIALGVPLPGIAAGIAALKSVPGRLERVPNEYRRFVYVDYAHTPDALANVLKALRALTSDRIICVFGCGGDRDRGKRPQMGAIVDQLSDWVVITSDNPRTESPDVIIADILAGIPAAEERRVTFDMPAREFGARVLVVEPDRRKAIALSVQASQPGDTILIAGKGHEPYQIVGREKFPFDDRLEAQQALSRLTEQKETGRDALDR